MKPNNFPLRPTLDGTEELYTQTGGVSQKFTLNSAKEFISAINVTYAELQTLISNKELITGSYYNIIDYKTFYDRPDYDKYKSPIAVSNASYVDGGGAIIMVLAIAPNKLAEEAYDITFPKDKIKYDVNYSTTESGNPALGRITERIDEFGNRADYDHRRINFKRYLLRTYNRRTPLQGTVEIQSGGNVVGTSTNFTSLLQGQVIAIPSTTEVFFEIVSITDDFNMVITGETIPVTIANLVFFNTNSYSYDSYYPNNVNGQNDFQLYNTFEAINTDGCINTYIGDHAKYFLEFGGGDFLLANNVLKDGSYNNNTIGDSSYNNTFNDDCTSNQIGYAFRNNITDDDFDNNVIGDFFENNLITANFQYNQIGYDFNNNIILNSSFYRNRIGNSFNGNWIDGDWGFDFQNNNIGNQFQSNQIYKQFYKNFILNGYNNNQTWDEFYGNKIGNGFNGNEIYNQFYDNQILDYFDNNTIGDLGAIGNYNFDNNIIGNNFKGNIPLGNFYGNQIGNSFVSNNTQDGFRDNVIGNNFFSNNIDINFGYNTIGYGFSGNIIANDFGYGGGQASGNKIGNEFTNNNIGEYFYDNTIADRFQNNTIGDDFENNKIDKAFQSNQIGFLFRNNDVKVPFFIGTNFVTNQGNILSFTNNTPNGLDNVYTNVNPNSSSTAYGINASFDVTVSGGIVTSVIINNVGVLYQGGDQLTINGSQLGGIDGVDDLIISVTNASIPYVNKNVSCTIFLDEDTGAFLYYIDNTGTLQVTSTTA